MSVISIENTVALQVIQALLGLVSGNVRAISFQLLKQELILFYLYDDCSNIDSEDIEDIEFELDVLTDGKYLIKSECSDVVDVKQWTGFDKRLVFRRK